MHDFGWRFPIVQILGGIVEAFIIVVAVTVLAGVIFLLVRYLLVATRAAELYVAQHEPPRPAGEPTPPAPSSATRAGSTAPAAPSGTTASAASTTAPSDSAPETSASQQVTKPSPTRAKTGTKPAAKPRTPKTPPSE